MEIKYKGNEKVVFVNGISMELSDLLQGINVEKNACQYLKYIEEQKIDSMAITEFYYYEDKPLYCFYRAGLYLKLKAMLEIVIYMDKIKESFKDEFKEATIITDNYMVLDVAKEIYNIKAVYEKTEKTIKKVKLPYGKLALRQIKGIATSMIFGLRPKNKPSFMMLSHATSINKMKSNDKEFYYDYEYGKLFNEIEEKFCAINLQYLNNVSVVDKSFKLNKRFLPFEMFLLFKKLKWKKYFNNNNIVNNLKLVNNLNFKYKEYDLHIPMLKYVFNNIEAIYMSYVKEYVCAKHYLRKLKIDNFITVDEADRARCFIAAGNDLGINTYAIQHGLINETSAAYMINCDKAKALVPKTTFLWGDKYKEVLFANSNAYDKDNLEVVGQLRTDYLVDKFKGNTKDSEPLKILYATQYLEDLTKEATPLLLKALADLEKPFKLVIRMHPVDPFKDYYEDLVSKYNTENVKITKCGDLYDDLWWSDIVISVHSTVVLEGALLNKPSICIVLPKYNDEGNFIKEGLSQGVRTHEELENILSTRNFNKDNFKSYIEKNFYKVDGKVKDRILKKISE